MSGEVGLGSKPIKVSMANQKNRSGGGSIVGGPPMHIGHQNGAGGGAPGGTWAATLDVQVGAAVGAPGPGGAGGNEGPGWPGIQSQHWSSAPAAAVAAAVSGVQTATPTPLTAHPDYNAYHQVIFFST